MRYWDEAKSAQYKSKYKLILVNEVSFTTPNTLIITERQNPNQPLGRTTFKGGGQKLGF